MRYSLLLLGVALTTPALSAEWVIDGRLTPKIEYDDNVLLQESKQSSTIYSVSPTLNFSRSLENNSVRASLGYDIERYASLSRLNRENPFADISASYQTMRSGYGISASYRERTVRSIAEEDTGDFSSDATVRSRRIAPSYSYQLTERDVIAFNASYSELRYDQRNFSDNDTLTLSSQWSRSFSERFSAGFNAGYTQYESTGEFTRSDYDSTNFGVNLSYRWTERTSITGSAGVNYLKSTVRTGPVKQNDSNRGTLASVAMSHQTTLDNFSLNLSRSLNPSGEGVLNQQDRVSFNWSRKLTDRMSFNLSTSYSQTSRADDTGSNKRKFTDVAPNLSWRMTETTSINTGYRYRKIQGDREDNINGNAVFVSFGYNWDGIRFSR
ncbi:long-chain fatty acid transport protein [Methylophaga lonarensis MPL]|uniref:Long-chain fatty acid transport protein n=1 Tax=Methylophaga lonarensis MPL TaxID=1286106 RepID=M7PKF5_9GAMM|nr:long-chain fatty acid transporter [Methylophaga lonarensis]EMR14345.1 long-chain fatty acid transport protein [Methylophaga lonarensis MPL]